MSVAATFLLVQSALAGQADFSKGVQSSTPSPFSWAGPYVGINGGGTFGRSYASDLNGFGSGVYNPDADLPPFDVLHYDTSGFTGGMQTGYNWQRGRVVYGVEADLGYLNVEGSGNQTSIIAANEVPTYTTQTSSTTSDLYSTLRGRLGVTLHDKWLFYLTGGAILLNYDESIKTSATDATHTAIRPGWTLGGGIEYALCDHWSLKGEYLYYGLQDGDVEFRSNNPPSGIDFTRFHYQTTSYGQIIRLGVNYHFGVSERSESPVSMGKDSSGKTMVALAQPEPEFTWTGPYLGLHFGYGLGGLEFKDEPPDTELNIRHYQRGIFGGAQTGVNYEFQNGIVLGVEGKFSGTSIDKHSEHNLNDEPNIYDTNIDWIGSATVRAGYACPHLLQGRLLAYVKAGMSDAHVTYHRTHIESNNTDTFDSEEGRFAPVIGGGIEYAIAKHWTVKAEYNFADYGTRIIHGRSVDDNAIETEAYETKLRLNSVELGVNFKF